MPQSIILISDALYVIEPYLQLLSLGYRSHMTLLIMGPLETLVADPLESPCRIVSICLRCQYAGLLLVFFLSSSFRFLSKF